MKKEMDEIKRLLDALVIVLEEINGFRLKLRTMTWSCNDVPSKSSRNCLKGLTNDVENSLYAVLSKYYSLSEKLTGTLTKKEDDIEELMTEFIKNALTEKKEKDNK